ncbi:MAG TPA: glycosyltransferase [Longimicrobiales bacterium]
MKISVVIPTRNRAAHLERALDALARQVWLPDEVVVVDASDEPERSGDLPVGVARVAASPACDGDARAGGIAPGRRAAGAGAAPDASAPRRGAARPFPVVRLRSRPGVCAQRNEGIRRATGTHVLLCDDDIELPPEYLRRLGEYVAAHPEAGAVTGVVCERDASGGFPRGFAAPSFRHLLFAFTFQLTVWADVEAADGNVLTALPLWALKRWYRRRGNTWTVAGWPLVTQVRGGAVRTATFGLGAALVRRDWLLASPYDERFDPHGIGDNYGVALGFPGERPITVLTDVYALHHRAPENRLDTAESYYRRVLALDYFLRASGRFSTWSIVALAWSLLGKAVIAAARRQADLLRQTIRALAVVVSGRNPLLAATPGSAAVLAEAPGAS